MTLNDERPVLRVGDKGIKPVIRKGPPLIEERKRDWKPPLFGPRMKLRREKKEQRRRERRSRRRRL